MIPGDRSAGLVRRSRSGLLVSVIGWGLLACAYTPLVPYSTQIDPLAEMPASNGGIADGRGRFREILCTVLEDHGQELEDYMPCQEALTEVGQEPPPSGKTVYLGPTRGQFVVGLVPGLGWQCVQEWLDRDDWGPAYLDRFGYEAVFIEVDALSGTTTNARQINDFLVSMPSDQQARPLILMGFSKGASDLLDFVVSYPETAWRVAAVVAVAGAIGGSALATEISQDRVELLTWLPGSDCDEGDGGALASLQPEHRRQWLADHPLPGHIAYFSVVTWPDPETRISAGLKSTYRKLAKLQDARNDGQVVFYDQVIPGSTLVAFPNADHWAMGAPVASHHEIATQTLVSRYDFPREAFLESVIRFVEEDLASRRGHSGHIGACEDGQPCRRD